MKVVLDASAIISGFQFDDDNLYLLTGEVKRELKNIDIITRVEVAEGDGRIRLARPSERSAAVVRKRLEKLGEEKALSEADVSALALALELKEKGEDAVLATDDYGIQNVAESLSINYAPITEKGIKKALTWHYLCTGCGQGYDKDVLLCEICGSRVKRRVKRG